MGGGGEAEGGRNFGVGWGGGEGEICWAGWGTTRGTTGCWSPSP